MVQTFLSILVKVSISPTKKLTHSIDWNSVQEVTAFIADNRGLLHAVYLMYAELSDDGPLIELSQFRSFCTT